MKNQYSLMPTVSLAVISQRFRSWLPLFLISAIVGIGLLSSAAWAQPSVPYTWKNVQMLGGGFVTGVIYSPTEQNLIYARTDVGGAYRWNAANSTWIPMTDFLGADEENFSGIVSIATDPVEPNRVYMATGLYTQSWAGTGAVLASTDKGNSWTRYNLPIKLGGNEDGRSTGERLQVDPNLNSTLYMGSSTDGLWKSTNFGAAWSKVASFPVATTPIGSGGISFVLFDKSSSTAGTATQTIYVGVLQNGTTLYKSTDAGTTWQAVAGQPALMPHHAELGANGVLYLAYSNAPGPNGITSGAVWKYNTTSSQWTAINPPSGQGGYAGISLDRQKPGTLVVSTMNRWYPKDEIFRSTDDGATWKPLLATAAFDHTMAPYAASSTPHWLGDVDIDPFDSNKAWFVTGYGVYGTTNLAVADAGTPVNWSFSNKGLEEIVPTGLISPPSGAPLVSVLGDLDGFRHDNLAVSPPAGRHTPRYGTNISIDFAENVPGFMARTHYNAAARYAAYSVDGGTSWTPFGTAPTGTNGPGALAISADGNRVVWSPGGTATAYSTDKGATWTTSTGLPNDITPISDRVNAQKFYAYDGATGRVLVSTNGGASFTVGATGFPTVPGYLLYSANIKAVFGVEGDVWLTHPNGFYHSTDSGLSFTRVPNFQSTMRIAYGKAAVGKTYPAVYVVGRLNNVYGFYRSDDAGATWVRINDSQHQYFSIRAFTADPRIYGRVYVGTSGRGILYGDATTTVSSLSLVASASPTQLLTTGTTTLSATVSGGTAPYSYTFSGPGTRTPNNNTALVSGLTAGVQTFTVSARDATTPNSQTISATVSVTVTAPLPFGITGVTMIGCMTVTAGERFVTFSPNYSGLTGQPVTLVIPNELTPTTNAGPYTLRLYTDNPVLTLKATQGADQTDFSYNWLTSCNTGSGPVSTTSTSPFALTGVTTISCVTVTAGERFVTFTPNYSGLTGQPVAFAVQNELAPTTNAGPYILRLYTDNPVLTLKATQGVSQSDFTYNWLAACNAGNPGSRRAAERVVPLSVNILGNPVTGETIEVEVRNESGEPLRLRVLDSRGRLVSDTVIEQPGVVERTGLRMGRSAGIYFLQVTTPTQKQVVKVVKP